ncbi:hypothetical protein VNO77_44629 [Canavalia gladiata]|uniref:non-specific serine/threonine protein kinase n=1 Tax=Canavalia gladiata TaxID=3824 RepID=A0AAN9PQX2_CANGL
MERYIGHFWRETIFFADFVAKQKGAFNSGQLRAMGPVMKQQLLVLCFSALLILNYASALVSDGRTLLSLLRHWTFVPPSIDSSWVASNSTPCSWIGVQCSHAYNVISLNLTSNGISGQLGPEIGQLHYLKSLVLLSNSFSGKIPSQLGNCSQLEHLDLSKNSFSGEIPNELGMLSELRDLDMSFNRLTGEIPVSIWRVQSLQHVIVHNNSLFGELPLEMTELKHLRNISLFDNQFSGVIPRGLGINSSLVKLDVMNNRFTGNIPPNLCYGKKLSVLHMGFNQLQGGISYDIGKCPSLSRLVLKKNNLTGSLPDFESNLNLTYVDISHNKISGAIPPSLANCTNLMEIHLSMNKFTGLIPSELGKLWHLLVLDLAHNNLEGPLPSHLSNCISMDRFDVGFNVLNGSFPASLRSWTRLTTLILEENHFTGGIPHVLSEFNNLLELKIGGNLFTGEIPKSMGALHNLLYGMNLSANRLSGKIPLEIGMLIKLQSLDVSLNNLTGSIDVLDELPSLLEVNISYNSFIGPVPKKLMKFLNSSPSSFAGNSHVCVSCSYVDGLTCINNSYLKPCVYKFINRRSISKVVIVMIEVGSSILVSVMLVVVVHMNLRKRSKQEVNASVDGEEVRTQTGKHMSSLIKQVMKVTNDLNDQYIVAGGAHGIIYRVQLSSDQVLAAKKIEFSSNRGKSPHKLKEIMHREIEIVEMINHPNMARHIDYWCGNDYGVILSQYMENGSLHDVLHDNRSPPPSLMWDVRFKIAVGVAKGLEYLHYDFLPPIVHRDIKPRNILLGFDMQPLINDFGTALRRKQHEHSSVNETTQRLSTHIAGTIGYIAPENAYSIVASRMSDVYSYGVVLLELLTRKEALDVSFMEDETNLVRWVRSVYREPQNIKEIADSSLAFELSQSVIILRQVTAVLDLALRCTERDPRKRPTMRKVTWFYQKPIFLKSRYDDVNGNKTTADETLLVKLRDFPNITPKAPIGSDLVPNPTVSTLVSKKEVSNFWQRANSVEDENNKHEPNAAWKVPPKGWVKVNTHGCVNEYGHAVCGGVIRGDCGEWLVGFTKSLELCPEVVAEIWGIYHGLLKAWDLQFQRVIIETDSVTAVQLLLHEPANKRNKLLSYAYPIALCRELIQRGWVIKVQYILREGNLCADWLANCGLGPNIRSVIHQEPPRGLADFLYQDICGEA